MGSLLLNEHVTRVFFVSELRKRQLRWPLSILQTFYMLRLSFLTLLRDRSVLLCKHNKCGRHCCNSFVALGHVFHRFQHIMSSPLLKVRNNSCWQFSPAINIAYVKATFARIMTSDPSFTSHTDAVSSPCLHISMGGSALHQTNSVSLGCEYLRGHPRKSNMDKFSLYI